MTVIQDTSVTGTTDEDQRFTLFHDDVQFKSTHVLIPLWDRDNTEARSRKILNCTSCSKFAH